jgi:hypothetical protein
MEVLVTVSVDESNPSQKVVSISVDHEPVDLRKCADDEEILWTVHPDPWMFTKDFGGSTGIAIKSHHGKFSNKKGANRKTHKWKRVARGGTYRYTISVTDGTSTISWDPTIMND